jgi:glycerol-3-phosphate acyltransferase PlsY
LVISYIIGSIPFGYLGARLKGIDIRSQGSGNIGATNVLRILGPKYAVPVLLLDFAKGALGAYLGLSLLELGLTGGILAGAAAIAGHNWSVFLMFRGGKGVATTAGVAAVVFPSLLGIALFVFLLVVTITKYVSLGSLVGIWSAFLVTLFPDHQTFERLTVFILCCLITYTHRSNIKRLISGTERRISLKGERSGS